MPAVIYGLLIVICLGCLSNLLATNVAVVVKVKGDVRVTPSNASRNITVKKGHILKDGDKIQTGDKASCTLKFLDDKTLVRIKARSSCVIEGKKDKDVIDKNIFVEVGEFFASLFKPKGEFKVTTPTSVASVKGTKFWVIQFKQSGETRYVVTQGIVEVGNKAGKALAKKGQTCLVASRNRRPEIRLTRAGDIPTDETDDTSQEDLEFEFEDSDGNKRVMRIKIEK